MKIKKILCMAVAMLMLCGCARVVKTEPLPPIADNQETEAKPDITPVPAPVPEPEPAPITLRITAAGDNLLHNTVSKACRLEGGGYDFTPIYENIADLAKHSDIAFVNQEVMLTGEEGAYPKLAAPAEAADALKASGFNIINLATNHSMDKGASGLEKSIENIKARSFDAMLGAFSTQEEAEKLIIVEKQGVKIGFLSYTYGTNGIPLPKDKPFAVSLIDEAKMKADMEKIRPQCDYLIASMHWGNEYQHVPSDTQKEQAQLLCDLGADLIIGTHPHVLQTVEWLTREDGGKTLCAYSLGNFVSNQQKNATMLGGMLSISVTFDPKTMEVIATAGGVIPTVTHYKKGYYRIFYLENYTEELAAEHGIHRYEKGMDLKYLNDLAQTVLGDFKIGIGDITLES